MPFVNILSLKCQLSDTYANILEILDNLKRYLLNWREGGFSLF